MSDPTEPFSDSLREYYFSAEPGVAALDTIELRHSAFLAEDGVTPVAVRFVNDPVDLVAALEADAPMNGGEEVTFVAGGFSATIPEQSSPGLSTFQLEVMNVSREMMPWMDLAAASNEPIQLSYRQYRSDELTLPGLVMHGLTIHSASAGILRVTAQAGYEDFLNRPHPSRIYTLQEFPGLAN
ncbi:MAG: DUF1833 family protein [Rhizomicrobium sp.]